MRRRLLFACTIVVVTLLMCLGVGEAFLRVTRPVAFMAPPNDLSDDAWRQFLHQPSDVPGLNYELVPGRSKLWSGFQIDINSHGMRDAEPLSPDTSRVVRLAAVGDSFTFGFSVGAEETYASVLERRLREGHPGFAIDVLNFGVGGYSTSDEAVVVAEKIPAWKPDVILIGYVLNDPETAPIQNLHAHFTPVSWWRHSHLARLGVEAWTKWQVKRDGGDYLRYLHRPDGAKWRAVEQAFAAIAASARELDAPVILVLFPETPWYPWARYGYLDVHQQVTAAARGVEFEVVDLLPVYARHRARDIRIDGTDHHPTPLAHRLAAEAIHAKLEADHGDVFR